MKLFGIALCLSLISISTQTAQGAEQKDCRLVVDPASVKVVWTAFKTAEKTPVSGTIKDFEIKTPVNGSKVFKALLAQTRVSGFVDGEKKSDSGNPARDLTLFEKFFKLISNQAKFNGAFNHIKGNDQSGELNLQLSLNGKTNEVPMKYTYSNKNDFEANGEFDLNQFGLEKALASLHEACESLHKGKDGVSKTWPTVALKLSAKINKDCGKNKK